MLHPPALFEAFRNVSPLFVKTYGKRLPNLALENVTLFDTFFRRYVTFGYCARGRIMIVIGLLQEAELLSAGG